MSSAFDWPPAVLVTVLLALMFLANEVGYRLGRARDRQEPDRSQSVSTGLKASILGLVALLLGFSYSMTSTRYMQRQRLVLDEANAIGTCYLRAGLLDPSEAGSGRQIRSILRHYTDLRLAHFETALQPGAMERTAKEMDAAVDDLWHAVAAAVKADHDLGRTSQIVPAANEVIDLSATRAWSSQNHLPLSVLVLLAACMVTSSGVMGHSSGQVSRRHLGLWCVLNVLVALVLFVILDFDRPRRGLIQVNHAPLRELQATMRE